MAAKRFIHIIKKLPAHLQTQSRLLVLWWLFKIAKNWVILNRIHPRLRPAIWRLTGCKIGKNVSIGYDVYYDVGNASYINIEDGAWIASRSLILCHKREMGGYFMGDDYNKLPYLKKKVTLKRGSVVGMGSIILPGVTIGEGSMVAAGSIVTKDVPPWTIVGGNPAKIMREVPKR